MSLVVAFLIGGPLSVGIGWMVWNFWNSNRLLDSKLKDGDLELLSSTNYKVSEVIRAPAGSRVEKVALQQIPINQDGYIRQTLPDGRIALIPIGLSGQVKSVHSTTHTNQQPPIQ